MGVCLREDALFEKVVIHGDPESVAEKFLGKIDEVYKEMDRFSAEQNKDFVGVLKKTYQDFLEEGKKLCRDENAPKRGFSIYGGLAQVAFRVDEKLKRLKKKKDKSREDKKNIAELKIVQKNLKNKLEIRIGSNSGDFPVSIVRDRHEVAKTKLVKSIIEQTYREGLKKIDPEDYDQLSRLEDKIFAEFGLKGFPELYRGKISRHTYLRDKEVVDPDFCSKQQALKSMRSYHEVLTQNKEFFDRCEMYYPLSSVVNLLKIYDGELTIAPNIELILSSLLNIDSKNKLIKELLGIDCLGKAVSIPSSIQCRDYHPDKDFDGTLHSKLSINKKMRLQINKSLSEGRLLDLAFVVCFSIKKVSIPTMESPIYARRVVKIVIMQSPY